MAHEFRLRVYYEDTDAGGVVYHANYLKFAERARTEALIGLGLSQTALRAESGLLFVVRALSVDFLAPARLEEELVVRTIVEEMGGARIIMRQDICRDARVIVSCRVTLVTIGADGRPTRTPQTVRERFATLTRA